MFAGYALAFETLLLGAGLPAALAGHLAGRRLAEGAWPRPGPMDPAQVQAFALTGATFALAAAVHLLRPPTRHASRRIAARMRSAAPRRWGGERTPAECARAYRAAGWAFALAASLLAVALLAALGVEPVDQSIAALAVAMLARRVLWVFAGLRFHPLACLAAAFALWAGVGWLGIV